MRVYFAHPCFTEEQERFKGEFLRRLMERLAARGLSRDIGILDPFLHTPNVEGDVETKLAMAEAIKTSCIGLLEDCDVVMALTDDDDTGTAFEAGYAHSMDIPIILISSATCATANAMLIGAARNRVDNVLLDAGVDTLVDMLECLHSSKGSHSTVHEGASS